MQIQVYTDSNIEGRENLAIYIRGLVGDAIRRFSDRISRIEVHIRDTNGLKNSRDDKHCMIEVRIKGHQPIAVTHFASTLNEAVSGAIDKVKRSMESTLERLEHHR